MEVKAMKIPKFFVGSLVVWFFLSFFEWLTQGVLLTDMLAELPLTFRTTVEMEGLMPWMFFGYLIMALGFCYIFTKGYEGKGVAEGMRFGFWVGITFGLGGMFVMYAVFPYSLGSVVAMSIAYIVEFILAGTILAAIYGKKK
jgi:hypothetical protein